MYAIVEDSGTQIKTTVGALLTVDLRELPADATTVTFDRVLMLSGDGKPTIGLPYVGGASVTAEIIERDFQGKKIDVIKYKRRKGFKKKQGHRQRYMKVKVSAINA